MTAPARFYGPHNTVECPDCGEPCDAEFGDHHGLCVHPPLKVKLTGAQVLRDAARTQRFLSINTTRAALIHAGAGVEMGPRVPGSVRTRMARDCRHRTGHWLASQAPGKALPVPDLPRGRPMTAAGFRVLSAAPRRRAGTQQHTTRETR